MNPHLIKQLFPNASKSLLAANAADYGTGKPVESPIGMSVKQPFSIKITVPIPSAKLGPNARTHWAAKSKLTKECRATAMRAALDALPSTHQPMLTTATVQVRWFSRTAVIQDRDNMIARCKAIFDGLADAGIIANDRGLTHLPPLQAKDKENPRVELWITETL